MTRASTAAYGIALALLGAWLASIASCSSCEPADFVAELIQKQRRVERDYARAQDTWSVAKQGDRFQMGDALRTGNGAEATLTLARQGRLLVKSDTVVRFMRSFDQTQPARQFDVLQGELTVESGDEPIAVRTTRGLVRVDQASTVRVRAERDATRFDVEVGHVEYTVNGQTQVAEAGASFELEVLEVSVESQAKLASTANTEQAPPEDTADAIAGAPDAGSARAAPTHPDGDAFLESPATALVTITAGESVTIHDPAPPTDLAVSSSRCGEQTALEIERTRRGTSPLRFRGSAEVRARVPSGSYRYRLRCIQQGRATGPVVGSGQLKVRRDAATRPLPLAPVRITADADGRRYTVSYQNRPPVITLRWPYAPPADEYHLVVQPAKGEQLSVDSAKATVTLPPGRLGEGSHRFWFETTDHKHSETGMLQVSFDYTARTAYLTSPREGSSLKADSARFTGGTLLGSSVHIQGAPMKLDSHGRFATTVTVPPELTGASVRVQHPSTGLHYYVRHLTR